MFCLRMEDSKESTKARFFRLSMLSFLKIDMPISSELWETYSVGEAENLNNFSKRKKEQSRENRS